VTILKQALKQAWIYTRGIALVFEDYPPEIQRSAELKKIIRYYSLSSHHFLLKSKPLDFGLSADKPTMKLKKKPSTFMKV